jgi:DNA ligase-associated metallophosphoesterase
MKTIQFAEKSLILDASGILFWPDREIAVVADLHLEKATYFAQQGQLLPPQESRETLLKLRAALNRVGCRSLILLGDSFHDAEGFARMDHHARQLWEQICKTYAVTFVIGNHDGLFVPPNTQGINYLEVEGITFRHQAVKGALAEISGHYHPKASLKLRGSRITRSCFIADAKRIILPAFGTLTGGMDIRSEEIAALFSMNYTAYLLGEGRVYSVPVSGINVR